MYGAERKRALGLLLSLGVWACGGSTIAPQNPRQEDGARASEETWLAALPHDSMLTYVVRGADGHEHSVRMLVQQRVERGPSIAVRLAPIGTPLGEEPVYPQWLVGSPDGLCALEEHAAFTTPGFVPIDTEGRLLTEAASAEAWRVQSDWLRADRSGSGQEASVGWTLRERVASINEPISAARCVRLEREEGSMRTTMLVCADLGMVELIREGGQREHWRLMSVGPHPTELQ